VASISATLEAGDDNEQQYKQWLGMLAGNLGSARAERMHPPLTAPL